MSDVTELNRWPSCVCAIDWSHDGIIALASHDVVELLFPNTESYDPDRNITQWRHFPLPAPWFTKEELPVKEPAPSRLVSLGEEISSSFPVALSWSPPGLAKHRRCALAILTANLALSIWSSEGRPQVETSWDRRLIINDTLEDYFSTTIRNEESQVVSDFEEIVRLRRRVRAFAWAPSMDSAQSSSTIGTQMSWGQHMIAVSNDDNQIVLLAINSPTSTFGVDKDWSSEVLSYFAVTANPENVFHEPDIFDEILQQQRHISHLAWSPWVEHNGMLHSVLAYATNEDVRARIVSYSQDNLIFKPEVVYPEIEIRHAGPMKWSPKVEDDDTLTLALFTNTEVICLTISSIDASILSRASHHLDGRWDSISGVAFDVRPKTSTRLHFSSLMWTTRYPTALLQVTATGLNALDPPNWYKNIGPTEAQFSAQYDLKKNAKAKVWGLVVSPTGDFIASCHTLHPTDMLEYGPPSDQHCTVAISNMASSTVLSFPTRNVSAEAVLRTMKKWVENNVETPEHIEQARGMIQERLLKAYGRENDELNDKGAMVASYTSTDLVALLTAFKRHVFLAKNTLKDRCNILTSVIWTPPEPNELARYMIMFRLANSLQNLPATLSANSSFSKKILALSRQVILLIQKIANDTSPDEEGEPQPITTTDTLHALETCRFCPAPIPFTDFSTATCTSGHQYIRCGLSFLTIHGPGITKYCGICDTPFLGDHFVMEQEAVELRTRTSKDAAQQVDRGVGGAGQDIAEAREEEPEKGNGDMTADVDGKAASKEPPLTLARVLFLACDACIYCGGKFVG